jgi:hypothetical protein
MKKLLFFLPFFFLSAFVLAQDIMLLPFVGKDNSEVVRAYHRKTGKSVEWYFDNVQKKMMKSASAYQLPAEVGIKANIMMKTYIGADGSEVLLIWNTATGDSESWYYSLADKKLMKSGAGYQLPKTIGLTGNVMMFPFIGSDGSEVILCWEPASGKSKSFYFDNTAKAFKLSGENYQLPAAPGVAGKVMMHPYIGADGSEVILVWDAVSGKSVSWYFSKADNKYMKSGDNYQLPANPDVTGNVMMYPYIGGDGSEVVLTWSVSTGASVMWYFDNAEKIYKKATGGYQLPATGITKNVMMVPFVQKNKEEVVYVWDTSTGASANFYFDNAAKSYKKSEAGYQLPVNVLQ